MKTFSSFMAEVWPWLVDVTLQFTLWAALTGLFLSLFPRLSAARRHGLWCACLLGIPLLMACSALWPGWRVAGPPAFAPGIVQNTAENPKERVNGTKPDRPVPAFSGSSSANQLTSGLVPTAGTSWSPPPSAFVSGIGLVLWLGGMALGGARLWMAGLRLRAWQQTLETEACPRLLAAFTQVLNEMDLASRDVSLIRGIPGCVPMTWGWRRPVILLPQEAAAWTDERLLLVLRHELGHVQRTDVIVSVTTALAALLLWFHPMVWWVWKHAGQAREAACDDLAFQRSQTAPEIFAAELLASVAVFRGRPARALIPLALAMAARDKAALKKRLSSILAPGQSRKPLTRRGAVGLGGMALGMAVMLSCLAACREVRPPALPAQINVISKVFSISVQSPLLAEFGLTLNDVSGELKVGVLDEVNAKKLLAQLGAGKGINLLSAPSVTTRSGERAVVQVVREFIYPVEFEPAKMVENQPGATGTLPHEKTFTTIPTTPTAFEMKPVGITMAIEPVIGEDLRIAMDLTPEYTSFEGFMDYGAPIQEKTAANDGRFHEVTLSENKMMQPIFSTLKLNASVMLNDGQYVVMGGLGSRTRLEATSGEPNARTEEELKDRLPDELVFFVMQAKIVRPSDP